MSSWIAGMQLFRHSSKRQAGCSAEVSAALTATAPAAGGLESKVMMEGAETLAPCTYVGERALNTVLPEHYIATLSLLWRFLCVCSNPALHVSALQPRMPAARIENKKNV